MNIWEEKYDLVKSNDMKKTYVITCLWSTWIWFIKNKTRRRMNKKKKMDQQKYKMDGPAEGERIKIDKGLADGQILYH